MAKSHLIQSLRRAYQIARFADARQISATTALELWELRISRRHLVRGSLAAAGALSALAFDRHQPQVDAATAPVLIVGAGIAGLTAAYYLNRSGVPVRIVEASQRVGGRILSRDKALGTDTTVELGGEFIDSGHKNIRKLAQEVGLVEVDLFASDRGLTKDVYFFDNRLIKERELIAPFKPLAKQIDRDVKAIGDVNYKSKNPRAIKLDRLSISAYLDRYCPDPLLRRLIEVAYTNEYGLEVKQQSAINLLLLIGKDPSKIEIFGSSDQRYQIRGGNHQIIDKLAQKLSKYIEVGTQLESIRSTDTNRYRVSLQTSGISKEYTFDRVILALPFSILRQLDLGVKLPPVKQAAIKELGYGTNTKVITSYSDRLWRTKYQSNGESFSDLELCETWEPSRYNATKTGVITNFIGGNLGVKTARLKPAEVVSKLTQQLDLIFPGVKNLASNKAIITDWIDSPYVRGSYGCYLVGQWTKFAGTEGERVGNLFFIGEHCSIDFQGYMEGGCTTGIMAAESILKDLKHSK
ncbi:NAD(P)/FAD-dependent oxidoreductase [Chamaesiphon sp. VAR_48_metabat_135_sub]|uniref:flavin monoamine oxidase family protein n=1 Tax=Chamaesiphon sp. VAR_48_metabat_135_sub TaxID=2964699 RepID=UPI00286CE41F|nr:NAD(P)/FAD-dependent oxidoreductase [Chamaesiphon sp. VAR_48_metabat_135_sub]